VVVSVVDFLYVSVAHRLFRGSLDKRVPSKEVSCDGSLSKDDGNDCVTWRAVAAGGRVGECFGACAPPVVPISGFHLLQEVIMLSHRRTSASRDKVFGLGMCV